MTHSLMLTCSRPSLGTAHPSTMRSSHRIFIYTNCHLLVWIHGPPYRNRLYLSLFACKSGERVPSTLPMLSSRVAQDMSVDVITGWSGMTSTASPMLGLLSVDFWRSNSVWRVQKYLPALDAGGGQKSIGVVASVGSTTVVDKAIVEVEVAVNLF